MILRLVSALLLASVLAAPAAASVVTEADGQFSKHWHSPTVIGGGVATVLGVAEKQNGHEFLMLSGLMPGAQTLTFGFTAPDWALTSYSYSAGGQVLWSSQPFRHAWDGTSLGSFQISRWTPEAALELVLGPAFQGPLYLGIYFTHGKDLSWRLNAPAPAASPEIAAVPLPASAGYAAAGALLLATFGLWSRRRLV